MATVATTGSGQKNHRKFLVALGVCLLVIIVVVAGVLIYKNSHKSYNQEVDLANQAYIQGNKAQALDHAKKALVKDPNNINAILLVANLSKTEDPGAAKQYYAQALSAMKQQNNPDVPGKSALTYWAAAELARQTGETSQAVKYYQQVIQAANPSDDYDQTLAVQAKTELASLK